MSNFELWEKMIKSKTYTKAVAIKRVNVISPLLEDGELEILLDLIENVYK